jgi:hypothetical protein
MITTSSKDAKNTLQIKQLVHLILNLLFAQKVHR